MKIAVVGNQLEFDEFSQKFGSMHECLCFTDHHFLDDELNVDCVFDFTISDSPEHFSFYEDRLSVPIFLNTIKMTLAELAAYYPLNTEQVYGFNGMLTFINREVLEITSLSDSPSFTIFEDLKTAFQLVDDRVGMVTPRIVCMIINEAFYTMQEGTASPEDIDSGMKLGTNYPFGPFEWLEKIGVSDVYELLEALYEDTKEECYKIAAALKKGYLSVQRITPQ